MTEAKGKIEERFFVEDLDIGSWEYGIRAGRDILAKVRPRYAEEDCWRKSYEAMTEIIKFFREMKIPRQATEADVRAWYAWVDFITNTNIEQGNDPYRGLK
jgi:hypothetical protein